MHQHRKRERERACRLAVAGLAALALLGGLAGCTNSSRALRTSASTTMAVVGSSASPLSDSAVTATTGTSGVTASSTPSAPGAPSGPGADQQAAATLAGLAVAPLNLAVPYERTQDFGPAWADVDHNGCDTRNDILHRDLTNIEVRPGTHDCVVVTGTLRDPYSGTTVQFLKAQASRVQIDHVVPLHAAWELGAYQWPYAQRLAFANDPANLLAVDAHNNEAKGDSLADTWVPPNQGEWCSYAQRTIAVHAAYHLAVTAAEKSALARLLGSCTGAAQAPPAAVPSPSPAAAPPAPPPPPATTSAAGGVYYANCAAVRAAGKAPLHRGDPGYRSALDRDGDGIACE